MAKTNEIIAFLLVLILVLAFVPAVSYGADYGTRDDWESLLTRQRRNLAESAAAIDGLSVDLIDRLVLMKRQLYLLESRFDRIMLYFDLTSENPFVLRDMLGVVEWFANKTENSTSQLRMEAASLDRHLQILSGLLSKIKGERESITKLDSPLLEAGAAAYFKGVADLQTKADGLRRRLADGLKSAEAFKDRLKESRIQIERHYDQALGAHLLKPVTSYFSGKAWADAVKGIRKWAGNFTIYTIEPVDMERQVWLVFGIKTFLFALVLVVGCRIALVHLARRFKRLSQDVRLFPFFLLWSIGLGLLMATLSTGLFPSTVFVTMVTIILVLGLISLSKNLGVLFFPSSGIHSAMLVPLWALVSAGALFQAFHIPEEAYIPVWVASLLGVCWYSARSRRHKHITPNLPRLIMLWAMPFLALVALMGWGSLSILMAMLLLITALDLRFAQIVSAFLGRLQARREEEITERPQARADLSLGFPFIFLILMILSLAWCFTFEGGFSLFLEVLGFRLGWDKVNFSLSRLVLIFGALFFTRLGISLARSSIARLPLRYRDVDTGSVHSLNALATYVLWSVFVLIALYLLGISLRNLAVVAGGLSVGLGFGLQNIVNNFIGGLILLFGRNIQPGDLVEIGNARGEVKRITIRNTVVQTFSGSTIFVPNSELVSQKLTNWSYRDPRYRQEIVVGVAYGSDTELVTELLIKAAKESDKVLDRPPPRVRFLEFGNSTLNFSLRIWIRGWEDRYADSEVRYHINRIFRENRIEISFPQLDLHLRSAEGLKDLAREKDVL
jgi:potassium efflux system protein